MKGSVSFFEKENMLRNSFGELNPVKTVRLYRAKFLSGNENN